MIARAKLKGVSEQCSASELVAALSRWAEPRLIVTKVIDGPSDAMVVDVLSRVVWVGERQMYAFVRPEANSHTVRELVVFLEGLVWAQLDKGAAGIDQIAARSDLVQPTGVSAAPDAEDNHQLKPSTGQILEFVATSNPGDLFVALGDELLALPKSAAHYVHERWGEWAMAARQPNFDLGEAVAATPDLDPEVADGLVSHLRCSRALRYFRPERAPGLKLVGEHLAHFDSQVAEAASERIRIELFADRFSKNEDFLLACLQAVMREGE